MNKYEMRKAAIKRLKETVPYAKDLNCYKYTIDGAIEGVFVDIESGFNADNVREHLIDLLTDDEPFLLPDDVVTYLGYEFAKGPRDADGVLWFSGDMSDSPWGVIEYTFFDGEQWSVSGHDISAPWIPADSIRHAPMRTATQREDDLVELLRDAAKDYQRERSEVEWQKELYKGLSDHVVSDMMLLPRDDDGEVIHIGDKITYHGLCERHQGKVLEVKGIMSLSEGIDAVVVYDTELVKLYANNCRHYPTVEDVLREFAIACEDTGNAGPEIQRLAGEYAKKLQLKEGEDEG